MDKKYVVIIMLGVMTLSNPAFADPLLADRQSALNNVTDYLTTVGKSQQDKKEILEERHDIRRDARLKSEARHKRAQTRQRMKDQEESILHKIRTPSN